MEVYYFMGGMLFGFLLAILASVISSKSDDISNRPEIPPQ